MSRTALTAVVSLLLAAACHAAAPAYVHISNMTLDVYEIAGDPWEGEYPRWVEPLGPMEWPQPLSTFAHEVIPAPGAGVPPYITGGADSNGFWLRFDCADAEGEVWARVPLGSYTMNAYRVCFDYEVSGLPPDLQLQVSLPGYPVVWHSSQAAEAGHFEADEQVAPWGYCGVHFLLTHDLVPEPSSAIALLCGLCALLRTVLSPKR